MALSKTTLRDEIDDQLSVIVGTAYDDLGDQLKTSFCTAIANAVHVWLVGGTGAKLTLHPGADIATTVTVASVSGVTTGAGTSGPGTGTGSGGIA